MGEIRGKCRLCKKERTLTDSHLLPAALYRYCKEFGVGGSDLVMVTKSASWPTSKQVTGDLLCKECEQLFNQGGEKWVLDQCYHGPGTFKLRDGLLGGSPLWVEQNFRVCLVASLSSVRLSQLVYFAGGVFWRAAVHAWRIDNHHLQRLNLSKALGEELRQFLLGTQQFPRDSALWIGVSDIDGPFGSSIIFPHGGTCGGYEQYKFTIPGITFHLFLGTAIPKPLLDRCTIRSPGNPVYLTPFVEVGAWVDFDRLAAKSSPSKRLQALCPRRK